MKEKEILDTLYQAAIKAADPASAKQRHHLMRLLTTGDAVYRKREQAKLKDLSQLSWDDADKWIEELDLWVFLGL